MSAYLIDPEKLGQIAHIIFDHVKFSRPDMDREFVIGILAAQNIRSLKARYKDNRGLTADGVIKEWLHDIETLGQYMSLALNVPYVSVSSLVDDRLEILREYAYQSCETDDWDGTLSCFLIDKTIASLKGQESGVVLDFE